MPDIEKAKILIVASDGFEQSELFVPLTKLTEAGAKVEIASPDGGQIKGWNEKDWGEAVASDLKIEDVQVENYDALVLPGGQINPDVLRTNGKAVDIVRRFATEGKVVAAICHAPWLLIEADVIKGRDATSYHSISTDMKNAGAKWRDEAVVVDNGIITSRSPEDLDQFVAKIIEEIGEGKHDRQAA